MFSSVVPSKDTFLNQARSARELRQNAKSQNDSAIKIQKVVRGWLCRKRLWREIRFIILLVHHGLLHINKSCMYILSYRTKFDHTFSESSKVTSIEAFKTGKQLVQTFDYSKDKERLEIYSRYKFLSYFSLHYL